MPLKNQGKFRFTGFEIDLARRTLQREGHVILVGPQSFDLLTILVLNAERVVPKEELMRTLGPDASTEETNLAQHIFLLQRALTGNELGKELILRMPGLGYKFTAQVTELAPDKSEPAPEPTPEAPPQPKSSTEPDPEVESSPQVFPRFSYEAEEAPIPARKKTESLTEANADTEARQGFLSKLSHPLPIASILATIVILAAAGWFAWQRLHHPHSEATPPSLSLILVSFQNSTGNPDFDQSLQMALSLDLRQSPYLSMPLESTVEGARANLKAPSSGSGPAAALQLCQQLKGHAYLTADLRRLTHNYLVTVRTYDCATGKDIAESRGIAETPDAVVSVLDKIAADLRKQLGESPKSVADFSKPLFSQRPPSLSALTAYADATHLQQQGKLAEAIQLYQRAIFLDPKFALAYDALANLHASLGHTDDAIAAQTKAYSLRETVDDQTRFILTTAYHDRVTGDLQASLRNDKQWAIQYPLNPVPLTHQANLEIQLGAPAMALDPARHALALNPDNPAAYIILARAQMHLGQFEEAATTCQQAIQRQRDSVEIHEFLLQIAFLRLDQPAIDEQMAWAFSQDSATQSEMQLQQAEIAFAEGRAKAATTAFQAVAEEFRKQKQPERATEVLAQLPRIQAELGFIESASAQLSRLPETSDSPAIPVAWAYVGETTRSASILKRQLDAHPSSTLWQQSWAPQIRAAIALNQHQPQAAIDALAPDSPASFDLSSFNIPAMRGRAYLALKQPTMAEGEFHKILDHPGIEPLSHNYPLSQLGLARSLAAQGKTTEAGFAYKIVLQIWKQADPDLPRLIEAKAEYAHLGSEFITPAAKPKPHKK